MTKLFVIGCCVAVLFTACGDATSDVVGTYSIDQADLETKMFDYAKTQGPGYEALPQAAKDAMAAMVKNKVAAMTLTIELKSDETFEVKGLMDGESMNANGTYTVKDDEVTMTITHEDGKKKESVGDDDVITCPCKDGVLEMKRGDDMPFSFKLRR